MKVPKRRISVDERTIMFSRAELEPGTQRFADYYADHPEHLEKDNRFRTQPGILKPGSLFFNALVFAGADATFDTVSALHQKVDGPVNSIPVKTDTPELVNFITRWCVSMGAHSVGITRLEPEHLYSVGGRKHNYGETVKNNHHWAIAFTVEMDYDRVKMSPQSAITLESSAQYLRAGSIAVTLSAFIRNLGYPARAHIDGNYQVRCPQVARDAGLGEIGRMSLLMTPDLGPRVRIGIVTTDIPLEATAKKPDPSVADFCMLCKKCAVNCPTNAISGEREPGGDDDWIINQEACYTYWCKSGTDCGRCLSVCPYSHRENFFHNTVRFLIRKSKFFRKIAVPLDNWVYGSRPRMRPLDGWMQK